MTNFRFAAPYFLALLPLAAVLVFAIRRRRGARSRPAALRYADIGQAAAAGRSLRVRLLPLLPALRWLALALLVVALARPQTGQARQIIEGEGVDIALALDISGSMASLDFEPQNRLEAAKQVIREFIATREFDRIGLVIFASTAFNQSPATADHAVLGRQLDQVKLAQEFGLEDGTAIGMGLANAASMLKDSKAESRVVILLTDGVNNAGEIDPITAAEAAAALGIRVYTIGAGRPGQVPFPMPGMFGQPQIVYQESEIDEDTLRRIAETTGGLYFRAKDTAGLAEVYQQINALEKSRVEVRSFSRYRELAGWLVLPALLLLLAEMVLRQTALRQLP